MSNFTGFIVVAVVLSKNGLKDVEYTYKIIFVCIIKPQWNEILSLWSKLAWSKTSA